MLVNLELSMLSGQTPNFVWQRHGNKFCHVLDGKIIELEHKGGELETNSKKHANKLLRAQDNLQHIYRKIGTGGFMKKAVRHYSGLRVTQSSLWESIACFVLSSNRSIPIIRKNVQQLMQSYGDKYDKLYSFPEPERVAKCSLRELRKLGCGFRDKYLSATAQRVLDRDDLEFKTPQELKEFLLSCPGIGEKIANCVLLYGYGDLSAFPIDVWIKRAMQEQYFGGGEGDLQKKANDLWGNLKGYAQIYLYYAYISKN